MSDLVMIPHSAVKGGDGFVPLGLAVRGAPDIGIKPVITSVEAALDFHVPFVEFFRRKLGQLQALWVLVVAAAFGGIINVHVQKTK